MANVTELQSDAESQARYNRIRERARLANQTFTPARPVQIKEIFAGRIDQLHECLSIGDQVGLHGILYGDRGVGKTSIANMVALLSDEPHECLVIQITCTSQDTFITLIRQIYDRIPVDVVRTACGFGSASEGQTERTQLNKLVPKRASFNPKDIAAVLKQVNTRVIAILDEFDRLDLDQFDLSAFTELVKICSDTAVDLHFLVVGVGDSVDQIIGNHASIVRNLVQIKLHSMNDDEIGEIVTKGMKTLNLSVDPTFVERVISFSCGYPHYTHLLCLEASLNTIRNERSDVESADLDYAIGRALSKAQESTRNSYHEATRANRQNIYKEVLQACGIVELDQYNTFALKDLEKPLSARLKRPMKTTQFGAHLRNLCKPERGNILIPIGERGRMRYRFRDPLMRAFVRMNIGNRR